MRLKSIELFGFKSFPDRTKLDFGSGMTVVVGPNGSGKSNISDAIRWVLGESSAKSVRGSKMEDVIFGGSDTRRALQFAEVSLTIDNSGEERGIDSDFDEITVTRRCYKNGDSEYMINRRPVRLKDINELFMNTGVGRGGYSIIGQGKIAEIISQKSDERRTIFEEAAGISKYRYKKNESERKIAAMEENLVRLNDILGELNGRLGPLEKEAEKARRYLDLYDQKKKTDIGLWLCDLADIRRRFAETDRAYTVAKQEHEIADEALNSLDNRVEKLFSENQDAKLRIEKTNLRKSEYLDKQHKLEASFAVLQNDITHLQEQIEASRQDIAIKQSARDSTLEKQRQLEQNVRNAQESIETAQKLRDETAQELETLRMQREELEAGQRELQKSRDALQNGQVESKMRLSALENARSTAEERRGALEKDIGALEESCSLMDGRIQKAREQMDEYHRKLEALQSAFQESEKAGAEAEAEAGRLNDELNRLLLDISSRRQRSDVLRRMEDQLEGYATGVRRVMNASAEGALRGIYGPVSRILKVKQRYAVAIETAVGANIQNIVVENEESAKAAIQFLKRSDGGRATFYPITSMKPATLNMDVRQLKSYEGYIGIASELVECEEKFAGIVSYMLGRTVVFSDLDSATVMAKATGYRIRIVTLDGQLINAGGSFTGGSQKRDSGMLTRSAEIARLQGDITALDVQLKAKRQAIAEQNARLEEKKKQDAALSAKRTLTETMQQAENTQLQVLLAQLKGDRARLEELKNEYDGLHLRSETDSAEQSALRESIAEAEQKLLEYAASAEESEKRHNALSASIHKKQDTLTQRSIALEQRRGELDGASRSLEFSQETMASIDAQLQRDQETICALQDKMIAAENQIENNKQELHAARDDLEAVEKELGVLYAESEKQDQTLAQLRNQQKEQSVRRENVFRVFTRLESDRSAILSEQDRLSGKLWDEYELTPGTAAEQGYVPVDAAERDGVRQRQAELQRELKAIGSCNTGAIEEYKEVSERHAFMSAQLDDLRTARANMAAIVSKLENEMRIRFTSVMEQLNANFKRIFCELFGGGHAELILEDPKDVLNCGIEINVAPPGKIIKNLSLLSGGEQSFAAIALFFAILDVNAAPFCVLDEIEAALDDVNVARFAEYALRYSDKTQFIIITHRRPTMERADTLYGVTMPQRGVSRVLRLDISEVEEKLGVKL